jgi:hypothetical protein
MKMQELLGSNTAEAIGQFHVDDFDEQSFLIDLGKNFSFKPKEKDVETDEMLKKIIKLSTVKVNGRMNSKEIKHSKFLKKVFDNFEVEML